MEHQPNRRKVIALLAVVLPVALGIVIVVLGHVLGHESAPVETQKGVEAAERRAATAPAAAGTPAPRVRLSDGASGARFDSSSLGQVPRAVVFISTGCGPIGAYLGRAVADLRTEGTAGAVLAISSDPRRDAPAAVRAWLARYHLKGGPFHFLVGSEDELRGYWNAFGFAGPASTCPESVPAHLVNGAGENAGVVDLDPGGEPSLLTDALAGMSE